MAKAFDNAHYLLIGALKAAPPAVHPRPPFHGGGPMPKFDAHAYVVAALWLADRVAPRVDPRDREGFEQHVSLARRQLEAGPDEKTHQRKLYDADASKVSRIPAKIGAWAAHEAANWAWRPIYAGGAARPAAANLTKLLVKTAPDEVGPFLRDVEALCVHLEALTMLRDRKHETRERPVQTLWRGHKDGKPTQFLLRLEGGGLALFAKLGARWALVEGARDDVLASVTDDQFDRAVRAVAAAGF